MIVTILIFLAGLGIYAGYGWAGFAYLVSAVLISYAAGRLTPRLRWVAPVSVVLNGVMLTLLKLQPVTGMSLLAPVGVSYFTLQIIAYNVDVFRGKYAPERNLLRYGLFVTYLPHLFLGPIERYDTAAPALFENRRITWAGVGDGALRLMWGLLKKYVIAARVGILVSAISADPETYRGAVALAAMLLYSLQLYSDFSGGIDMVLGVSRMLGITLSENFDAPYLSESFQEFWRRWHMTLGSWLREYVYIPLGGNRKGTVRKVLNTLVTFLVSGLWHGVEYLLWGLINGIFVCFGSKCRTRWKHLNRLVTFLLVSLLWCFFIWPDAGTAMAMVASVFTGFNAPALAGLATMGLSVGDVAVLVAASAGLWCYDVFRSRINRKIAAWQPWAKTALICALGLVVLVFGVYGVGFEADAFIYSRY